jgi:hypothetical protein
LPRQLDDGTHETRLNHLGVVKAGQRGGPKGSTMAMVVPQDVPRILDPTALDGDARTLQHGQGFLTAHVVAGIPGWQYRARRRTRTAEEGAMLRAQSADARGLYGASFYRGLDTVMAIAVPGYGAYLPALSLFAMTLGKLDRGGLGG